MDSSKLSVKFYLDDSSSVKLADVALAFHSWIQMHSFPDHLLIDVADYAHVPDGPGIALISREANIYFDTFDGRPGLSYWRKEPLPGSFADRLKAVFDYASKACSLLEESPALNGAKFRTDEFSFKINDRLLAANTAETFSAIKPDLERALERLNREKFALEHRPDSRGLFEVKIKTKTGVARETIS